MRLNGAIFGIECDLTNHSTLVPDSLSVADESKNCNLNNEFFVK